MNNAESISFQIGRTTEQLLLELRPWENNPPVVSVSLLRDENIYIINFNYDLIGIIAKDGNGKWVAKSALTGIIPKTGIFDTMRNAIKFCIKTKFLM